MAVPEDAFDPIGPVELAELRGLVARVGPEAADRLVRAVSAVAGITELYRVTHREWATLRIALTVASTID